MVVVNDYSSYFINYSFNTLNRLNVYNKKLKIKTKNIQNSITYDKQ